MNFANCPLGTKAKSGYVFMKWENVERKLWWMYRASRSSETICWHSGQTVFLELLHIRIIAEGVVIKS